MNFNAMMMQMMMMQSPTRGGRCLARMRQFQDKHFKATSKRWLFQYQFLISYKRGKYKVIKSINNINLDNKYSFKSNSNKTPSFGNANLSKEAKYLNKFIKSQENLSTTRFIQGTMTNGLPKARLS